MHDLFIYSAKVELYDDCIRQSNQHVMLINHNDRFFFLRLFVLCFVNSYGVAIGACFALLCCRVCLIFLANSYCGIANSRKLYH